MDWNEIQRAMVVFAHPDDAEFGTAGTVARMTCDGKEVVYVVVTDGSKGSSDPAMTRERLTATREREQRAAAEVLRVSDVCFLGFEDGVLEPSMAVRKAISAAIRKYKPDVVISQSPVRDLGTVIFAQHPDHLAAGEATLASVYPSARDRMTFPELLDQGLEPHIVREVWIVGTGRPDFFVDVSTVLDMKVRALRAHKSQVGERNIEETVPQRARALAEGQDMDYAEAFLRMVLP